MMTHTRREQLLDWKQQIEIIPPAETLDEIAGILQSRTTGAYLRFGAAELQLLSGLDSTLQTASAPLTREIQEALLLEGPGIFKALPLECPGLGLQAGSKPGLFGVSDRQALHHLQQAGRYFPDGKIYHPSALAYLSVFEPQEVVEFLAELKSFRPLFVGNEYTLPDLIQLLFGHAGYIPAPRQNAYAQVDRMQDEVNQFPRWDRDYPVVVVAMGCSGRVLAKRLLKSGFKGFVFDFGDLLDALSGWTPQAWVKLAPHPPRQILRMEWPQKPPVQPYAPKARPASPPLKSAGAAPIAGRWISNISSRMRKR